MPDDISSLFTFSVYVEAILGLLLLFTWLQNTSIKATAWWGNAHLLRAGSIALFGMYGRLPDAITIDVANAILLTSFAVTWTGARLFGGHKPSFLLIFGGAIVWLIVCALPGGADSTPTRAFLSAAIIGAYTWSAAAELWRNNEGLLVARLPAISLLLAHGALFLLRTPLGLLVPHPAGTERLFGSVWFIVLSSEALLFTIAIAFILMAMALERTAYLHKIAALVDPLTGVWNQRGLMFESDRLMKSSQKETKDAAVLLVELDNFRAINDRYGRALGDQVLLIFVQTAKQVIRSSDFVGRLGGEEFAVVLYDSPGDCALTIAERIRSAFAERATVIAGHQVGATISIGLVKHEGPMVALTELLWKADRELHRTRQRGRKFVESLASDGLPRGKELRFQAL
jgi:diguanylate cyclase (GGDEF)-like protein